MEPSESILIGRNEIAGFLRISAGTVDKWRSRYKTMPVFQESEKSFLMADKQTLGEWARKLARGEVVD